MQLKKCLLFFFLFQGILLTMHSQNIIIKGTVEKASNKNIRLFVYNDRISMYENLISEVFLKSDADTFSFKLSTNYPMPAILQIETYAQEFYVEPNHTYEITISEFDWSQDEKASVNTSPMTLPILLHNKEEDNLNDRINAFDVFYMEAVAKNSYRILVNRDKKLADSLILLFRERFDSIENDYFIQYKKYKEAAIEFVAQSKSKNTLFAKYFENQPILYRNEGYMDFFNMFFESFFINGTKYIKKEQISGWIERGDLFKFLDSLGTEPMLRNERFRELVFLKGMNEAYHKGGYKSHDVTKLLQTYMQQTKFDEYKLIAQGIIDRHEKIGSKLKIESIKLPDVDKKIISLDTFKGKWIYLSFARLREQPSLRELASMAYYYDSIVKAYNIEFITISCDREFQKMYHFLKNSKDGDKYHWTWLHFDNDYDLLNAFKVRIYPFFILINPEGKIVSYPAKSPEEGFFLSLQNYIEEQKDIPDTEE